MNHARLFTLLGLAALVVAFAVTWVTVPSASSEVPPPASLFIEGLGDEERECLRRSLVPGAFTGPDRQTPLTRCRQYGEVVGVQLEEEDIEVLKNRILVVFGSAAAVVVLLGLAFGAGRRSTAEDARDAP